MTKEIEQTINAPVHGHVVGGNLTVTHTINNHGPVCINSVVQQPPFALQPPPSPPASRRKYGKTGAEITPAQKELLALMKPLPAHVRLQVLDYMRNEFGTGMVMDLEPRELHRTRQQVLDARRSAGI